MPADEAHATAVCIRCQVTWCRTCDGLMCWACGRPFDRLATADAATALYVYAART